MQEGLFWAQAITLPSQHQLVLLTAFTFHRYCYPPAPSWGCQSSVAAVGCFPKVCHNRSEGCPWGRFLDLPSLWGGQVSVVPPAPGPCCGNTLYWIIKWDPVKAARRSTDRH